MIKEKIRQLIEELKDALDELDEAHTIITRQPWVLWNDRVDEVDERPPFFQRLIDLFNFHRKE